MTAHERSTPPRASPPCAARLRAIVRRLQNATPRYFAWSGANSLTQIKNVKEAPWSAAPDQLSLMACGKLGRVGRPPFMPSSAAREHPLGAYSRRFPAPAVGDGGVAAVDVGRQSEAAFGSWSTARIGTLPRSSSVQPSQLCSTFHGGRTKGLHSCGSPKNPPPRVVLGLAPVSSF
jgi:hypothetical protein